MTAVQHPRAMTTVIAEVPFADSAVRELRLAYDWSARLGVPAHITLLGPFLPPDAVGDGTTRRLEAVFRGVSPLRVRLAELSLLDGTACLLPEFPEGLVALTARLEEAWPDVRRYGKRHHVTLARGCDRAQFERIRADLEGSLPLSGAITEGTLLERRGAGDVHLIGRFPFGGDLGSGGDPVPGSA